MNTTQLSNELEQARIATEADWLALYLACDPYLSESLVCVASVGAAPIESGFVLSRTAWNEPGDCANCLVQRGEATNQMEAVLRGRFPSPRSSESLRESLPRWQAAAATWRESASRYFPTYFDCMSLNDALRDDSDLNVYLAGILRRALVPLDWNRSDHLATIRLLNSRNELRPFAKLGDCPGSEGVARLVAVKKSPLLIGDLKAFTDAPQRELLEARSHLSVPILVGDRCFGTITLESVLPDQIGPHWVGYLTRIGGLIADALLRDELNVTHQWVEYHQRAYTELYASQLTDEDLAVFPDPATLSTRSAEPAA